jgi:hypothetical protein
MTTHTLTIIVTILMLSFLGFCVFMVYKDNKYSPGALASGIFVFIITLFHLATTTSKEISFEYYKLERDTIQKTLNDNRCLVDHKIIDFNVELARKQKKFQKDPIYRMYQDERIMNLKPIN